MSKPKKAWLHKANDNYYTEEQFQHELAHKPWLSKSYIPFVEDTVSEAGKNIIENHAETFLRLRISELEDQIKEWKEKCHSQSEVAKLYEVNLIEARKSGHEEGYEDGHRAACDFYNVGSTK